MTATDNESAPLDIPNDIILRVPGFRFRVVGYETESQMYICMRVKNGETFKMKKDIVEGVFVDRIAVESTRQIRSATGRQRYLRTDTNDDEEATFPKS